MKQFVEPDPGEQELQEELARGVDASKALVAHIERMGAARVTLPVEHFGRRYLVFVTEENPSRPLTLNQHQALASRTLPEPAKNHWFGPDLNKTTSEAMAMKRPDFAARIDLLHALLGLAGEVGELIDPVKKSVFYGTPLDIENVREEVGDLLWYIAAPMCRALGVTLEELAAANVAKLRKRYPQKYTDAAAVARADKLASEPAPQPYPPKPDTVTAGMRLRTLTEDEQRDIRAKYSPQLVDFGDGYYWDEDMRSWQVCPELWEQSPANV